MNKIMKCQTGSHLYKLTTPKSDVDYSGIFIRPLNQIITPFDTKQNNEIDLSVISKLENGKNSSDAVDEKWFSLSKFFKLAADNNPNIFELFFAEPIFKGDTWDLIVENKDLFFSKRIEKTFIGYAKSQLSKLRIKDENVKKLDNIKLILSKLGSSNILSDNKEVLGVNNFTIRKHRTQNTYFEMFKVADITLPGNITVKKAIKQIDERITKRSTYRQLIIDEIGYDTKFAHHTLRILDEGISLIENRDLSYPLKNHKLILDVKLGKINYDNFEYSVEVMMERISDVIANSTLPEFPKYDEIQLLYQNIVSDYYFEK